MRKAICYRYMVEERDLCFCPSCGANLRAKGGVEVTLLLAGRCLCVPSCLGAESVLADTQDDAIAQGFHSETRCGSCSLQLTQFEVRQ